MLGERLRTSRVNSKFIHGKRKFFRRMFRHLYTFYETFERSFNTRLLYLLDIFRRLVRRDKSRIAFGSQVHSPQSFSFFVCHHCFPIRETIVVLLRLSVKQRPGRKTLFKATLWPFRVERNLKIKPNSFGWTADGCEMKNCHLNEWNCICW